MEGKGGVRTSACSVAKHCCLLSNSRWGEVGICHRDECSRRNSRVRE